MHKLAIEVPNEARFWDKWSEHEAFLLALCRKWTQGNELDARELLSAVMLHAFEGASGLDAEIVNHRAWFAKVLRNYCIDYHRKQSRHPQIKIDPEVLGPMIDQQLRGQHISVEGKFIKEEGYQHLLARVDGLPKSLREAMVLRACQDLSYREIASQLHISCENARKRVELARKRLRNSQISATKRTISIRNEQAAVEGILSQPPALAMAHHLALPVMLQLEGRKIEIPVFLLRKPIRMAQKEATLHKYMAKHPGGWKKELEYALHCWSMGKAEKALCFLEATFQRHAHVQQVTYNYLRLLAEAKEWDRLGAESNKLLNSADKKSHFAGKEIVLGFLAMAKQDFERAVFHWKNVNEKLIFGLKCQVLFRAGKREAAGLLAKEWMAIQPMQREPFFYLAALETTQVLALEYARTAIRRFSDDPYAKAFYLLIALRDKTEIETGKLEQLLAQIRVLAPDTWLFAICQWAVLEMSSERGNCTLQVWERMHPEFQKRTFTKEDASFEDQLSAAIGALVFP